MRRESSHRWWKEFVAEHGEAINEMRQVLRDRETVSNRDFEMSQEAFFEMKTKRQKSRKANLRMDYFLELIIKIGNILVILEKILNG